MELRMGTVLFSFLYPQLLAQHVEHSRLPTNVSRMNVMPPQSLETGRRGHVRRRSLQSSDWAEDREQAVRGLRGERRL